MNRVLVLAVYVGYDALVCVCRLLRFQTIRMAFEVEWSAQVKQQGQDSIAIRVQTMHRKNAFKF